MYLVFTTSTGEAIIVVQKPAPNADVKWHGRSSVRNHHVNFCWYSNKICCIIQNWLTSHRCILQKSIFDEVISHQFSTIHYGITGDVWASS